MTNLTRSESPLHLTESHATRSLSVIGPELTIDGEIGGSDDLRIDGTVRGRITLLGRTLTVGPAGQLMCDVEAGEIVVHGKAVGNLRASGLIAIRRDASVDGTLTSRRLVIEDGAYVKVHIDMEGGDGHRPEHAG